MLIWTMKFCNLDLNYMYRQLWVGNISLTLSISDVRMNMSISGIIQKLSCKGWLCQFQESFNIVLQGKEPLKCEVKGNSKIWSCRMCIDM